MASSINSTSKSNEPSNGVGGAITTALRDADPRALQALVVAATTVVAAGAAVYWIFCCFGVKKHEPAADYDYEQRRRHRVVVTGLENSGNDDGPSGDSGSGGGDERKGGSRKKKSPLFGRGGGTERGAPSRNGSSGNRGDVVESSKYEGGNSDHGQSFFGAPSSATCSGTTSKEVGWARSNANVESNVLDKTMPLKLSSAAASSVYGNVLSEDNGASQSRISDNDGGGGHGDYGGDRSDGNASDRSGSGGAAVETDAVPYARRKEKASREGSITRRKRRSSTNVDDGLDIYNSNNTGIKSRLRPPSTVHGRKSYS